MSMGSSVRGLSEVTTAKSAFSAAMRPMMGRFVRSRSPPQPKRATTRPFVTARMARSTFSRASGVWA